VRQVFKRYGRKEGVRDGIGHIAKKLGRFWPEEFIQKLIIMVGN